MEWLKEILQKEINDIRKGIEDNSLHDFEEMGHTFSRGADRNGLIGINTLRWALVMIETLDR